MQINLISATYKISPNYTNYNNRSINNMSKPQYNYSNSVIFSGSNVVQKTVSSKILHEKTKLLSHLKNILETEIPVMSEEEKLFALLKKTHALISAKRRRVDEIEQEIEFLNSRNTLNPQQKLNRSAQLIKELNRITKMKQPQIEEAKPSPDNYDYALINKFKNAVMDDNYNLESVYNEHYNDMRDIQTVEEFKENYPSIRIPSDPKDVLVKKIMNTFNRKFYTDFDQIFNTEDENIIALTLTDFYQRVFTQIAPYYDKSVKDLMPLISTRLTKAILKAYQKLKIADDFESIPEAAKSSMLTIRDDDVQLLDLDYDSFVLSTLKQHYLEGKKLNQIEYIEGDKKINISSIKSPDYRFEKQPEKIKKLINDAKKLALLQRDYQNFTPAELQSRLNYYIRTEYSNSEEILNLIVDFDNCKFTEEDKQYLIKFLNILDSISDKKITLQDGLKTIQENDIRPHGTVKLDEIERKALEEKIKLEQIKNNELNQLREEFNSSINSLYKYNLASIIPSFTKFYPETFDEKTIREAKSAIKMIKESIALDNPVKIKTSIMRREAFLEYSTNNSDSAIFAQSLKYADNFPTEEQELRSGQYLLNREIIDCYPDSMSVAQNKKILQKIMDYFDNDKNLATTYLCKYENYSSLDKPERQSILNILKIFDVKNPNDRIILKHIIENDYINCDTTYTETKNTQTFKSSIAAEAKKDIMNKYKFPGCINLFEAFEEAMTTTAGENGMSGIKKTGSHNNAIDYKMELKIMGYPDRLFSSKNDYRFDIYSDKGLH